MLGTILLNRYRLEVELGRGGMGLVYRAHDTLLERDVAVKVLGGTGDSALDSPARTRLLHEARAAAQLNHPHIVSIYDAGEADGTPFIIMELVNGKALSETRLDSLVQILDVARQICAALEHAHAHGIIHRDLKPGNVIVESDLTPLSALPEAGTGEMEIRGIREVTLRVKLTDFGLARSVASHLSAEGSLIGTVFYMAPEQALGQSVDGRTDLYSLGVMLYELVAGRLPFAGDDPLVVISQHLYAPVIPPSTYSPTIPPLLERLILQLLSKQPEDRPVSATAVLQALEQMDVSAGRPVTEEANLALLSPLDRLVRGRLFGREKELGRAKTLWHQIFSGEVERNVLLITGESGVGKTPLVREIRTLAEVSQGIVLAGVCYDQVQAPYAPITEMIRQGLMILESAPSRYAQLAQDRRQESSNSRGALIHSKEILESEKFDPATIRESLTLLPDLVLSGLITLVPDLQSVYPHVPPSPALEPIAEQQRLFESVQGFLQALTAKNPLLIVVEDTQWADSGTISLLRYLARRSHAARLRLLFVLTYRETLLERTHPLNDLLYSMTRERLSERIQLDAFDRQQTGDLLAMMFQDAIKPEFLDNLYQETQGNPFFVEEVCKALIEEGILYREDGHWHWPENMRELRIPQNVRLAIQERLARLTPEISEVLRLAAMIGREFDFETLRMASDLDEDALIEALEAAEKAQLVEEVECCGKYSLFFKSGLTVSTLRESLSGLRRRRMHNRIAAALEALKPNEYAVLAYHYFEAGDQEKARAYYVQAGKRAAAVFSNQDAIRYFSEALSLTSEDSPERFDVLVARAKVFGILAQRQELGNDIEAMNAIAEKLNDDERRCDASIALADYLTITDYALAREPAKRALELAHRIQDPLREGRALRCLGYINRNLHELKASQQALEAAIERFHQANLPGEAAICLHMLSLTLGDMGDTENALKVAEQALASSRSSGDSQQEANSLRRVAIVYFDKLQPEKALPYAEAALALHRQLGDRANEALALNVLGLVLTWLRRAEEGRTNLRQSLQVAEEIGLIPSMLMATENLVWTSYIPAGEHEAALAFIDERIRWAEAHAYEFMVLAHSGTKGEILIQLGQFEAAMKICRIVHDSPLIEQEWPNKSKTLAMMGRLEAETGHYERANEILADASHIISSSGTPVDQAWILIIQAQTALLSESTENLRQGLERALKAIALLRGLEVSELPVVALITAAYFHLQLGETEAALKCSSEGTQLTANWPYVSEEYRYVQARVLRAAGQEAEAKKVLRQAYERVMLVANRIQDPELLRSWLENARLHKEILADWEKWGGG